MDEIINSQKLSVISSLNTSFNNLSSAYNNAVQLRENILPESEKLLILQDRDTHREDLLLLIYLMRREPCSMHRLNICLSYRIIINQLLN